MSSARRTHAMGRTPRTTTATRADAAVAAARAIAAGRMVVLIDDGDRASGGFLIMAGQHCTAADIGFMRRYGSGIVSAPLSDERAASFRLGTMAAALDQGGPAFTLAVDAATGITTGISAEDRARTMRVLADPASTAADLVRPGHIFPMRARPGGVLERAYPTEAAVDLCRLAGTEPVAVASEILTEQGDLADAAYLARFARRHGLACVTITGVAAHRLASEQLIRRIGEERIVLPEGRFRMLTYALPKGAEHIVLVRGDRPTGTPSVTIHRECVAGHVFGSSTCDCRERLRSAIARIAASDGVLILLRVDSRDLVFRALGERADDLLRAQILRDLMVADPAPPGPRTPRRVRTRTRSGSAGSRAFGGPRRGRR